MISIKTVLLALVASTAVALPIRREVPQEHSHNAVLASVRTSLAINNPAGIQDPVFGLLGDAAAAAGQGKITNTDCLQQATADQAFTNAKAKNDVNGMTQALIYRALERNTGKVGLASVACTAIKAVNPQIAAVSQHQDPASSGAAATNKAIVLELAKQIASIGGNPQDALLSGTFKPGNLNDSTGKGNTCDDANDTAGCIISQKLIVDDATAAEISAAVAGVAAPAAAAAAPAAAAAAPAAADIAVTNNAAAASSGAANFGSCSTPEITFADHLDNRKETSFEPTDKKSFNHGSADNIDIITQFMCDTLTNSCKANQAAKDLCTKAKAAADTATAKTGAQADAFNAVFGKKTDFAAVQPIDDQGRPVGAAATPAAAPAKAAADVAVTASSNAASGNLQKFTGALGGAPPAVTTGGKGFVTDNSDFVNLNAALGRSCDVQHNACSTAANSKSQAGLTSVSQCDQQNTQCHALIQ